MSLAVKRERGEPAPPARRPAWPARGASSARSRWPPERKRSLVTGPARRRARPGDCLRRRHGRLPPTV